MGRRKKQQRHPWTSEQVALLVREWGVWGARALLRTLRPHSWVSIRRKADRLGLPRGIPQGCASLAELARRCGISAKPLAKILEDAGVQVRNVYPGNAHGLTSYAPRVSQRRYAEADEAVEAFERWLTREMLRQAAVRLGSSPHTLYARARRAGLFGEGKPLHLLPEQWDALATAPPFVRTPKLVAAFKAVAA